MNRISAFKKKIPESSPAPSTMSGDSEKMVVHELGSGPSPDTTSGGTLILDL